VLEAPIPTVFFKTRSADVVYQSFHCLFCHGYEDRGAPSSGVLVVQAVNAALGAHMAQNAAQLTNEVTLYTNGDDAVLSELKPMVGGLDQSKFKSDTRKIKQLAAGDAEDSVIVEFDDGTTKSEKFLVHNPQTTAQGPFVAQLGLATTPGGDIQADGPFYQTSVPGVYAVGDCSTPYKVTPSSITSGCNAAVAAAAEIQAAKYSEPPKL
jgi:gliotoxin/aspirochlorine biosynthesis thioredoxin reductase